VVETVDATKVRYSGKAALALLTGIDRLIAARGKKLTVFDLKNDRPDDETLSGVLLGPTGNLRAPTARIGTTLVVGFNDELYQEILG
jgi:hypothetical protein